MSPEVALVQKLRDGTTNTLCMLEMLQAPSETGQPGADLARRQTAEGGGSRAFPPLSTRVE